MLVDDDLIGESTDRSIQTIEGGTFANIHTTSLTCLAGINAVMSVVHRGNHSYLASLTESLYILANFGDNTSHFVT